MTKLGFRFINHWRNQFCDGLFTFAPFNLWYFRSGDYYPAEFGFCIFNVGFAIKKLQRGEK